MKVSDSFYAFYPSQLFSEYFKKYFNNTFIKELQDIEFRCKSVDDVKQLKVKYGALLDKKCDQAFLYDVASAKEILMIAKDSCFLGHSIADEIHDASVNLFSQLLGILSLVLGGGFMLLSDLELGEKTAIFLAAFSFVVILYIVFAFKTKNKEATSEMDRLFRTSLSCMSIFESIVKERLNS